MTGPVAVLVLALMISYVVSLSRNPWRPCRWCNGKPDRRGWFYFWSWGRCTHCNGEGRKLRFGRRVWDRMR